MNNFKRIMNGLYKGLVAIQALLLVALLSMVTLQIATRIIPFFPYVMWTEEISRFLLVWVVFLGASIGVKEVTHFTVSLLPEPKSAVVAGIWEMFIQICMIAFAIIFTYRGFKYAKVMIWDISDIAQISMIWVGAAIPVFGILSLLFLVETMITRFSKERV